MSDQELLTGFSQGETVAVEELYRQYYPLILGMLLSRGLPKADAEDIFQEAVLAELVRMERDGPGKIDNYLAWFKRIAFNHYLNLCRKNKRRADVTIASLMVPDSAEGPEEILHQLTQRAIIDDAFSRLRQECRQLLNMVIYGKKKSPKIAKLLGLKEATVRKRISRCRAALCDFIRADIRHQELNEHR